MTDLAVQAQSAAAFVQRLPADLAAAAADHVQVEVAEPLARSVHAAAHGPYGPRVAVWARPGVYPTIMLGGQGSVVSGGASGAQLFYGTEWGGSVTRRTDRHKPYPMRIPNPRVRPGRVTRTRVSVWRNTTRQFVPARPFWGPTVRRDSERISEAWAAALDPFVVAWAQGA